MRESSTTVRPSCVNLQAECDKACNTLKAFRQPELVSNISDKNLAKYIPENILAHAKGLAFLTVIKAGFIWSGRLGTGIVVARLPDHTWSAPCAISTMGAGVGGQIGANITDFVFVLNSRKAVKAFATGNFSAGVNLAVAAGPWGRSAETAGAIGGAIAPVFSYCNSAGLFAGISIELGGIVVRSDANAKAYGHKVSGIDILMGKVPAPEFARELYEILPRGERLRYPKTPKEKEGADGVPLNSQPTSQHDSFDSYREAPSYPTYTPSGPSSAPVSASYAQNDPPQESSFAQAASMAKTASSFASQLESAVAKQRSSSAASSPVTGSFPPPPAYSQGSSSNYSSAPPKPSAATKPTIAPKPAIAAKPSRISIPGKESSVDRYIVQWDFSGIEPGDLHLRAGEPLVILEKSGEWWKAQTSDGRVGTVPSNYVCLEGSSLATV